MKITPFNTHNKSQTFKATKVANTVNTLGYFQTEIQLYKIGREDKSFLEKLQDKINFKELCPTLSEDLQKRWQKVFNYCIARAQENSNTTYIALNNEKPCGILTYKLNGNKIDFEGICSIPHDKKKVPYTGQTLMYQLFKDADASKVKSIELRAVTDGPFNVVTKYEKRGFKADPASGYYTNMRCNKYNIPEQLKNFQAEIAYYPTEPEKVLLDKYLD